MQESPNQQKQHTLPTERITVSIEKMISKNGLEKTADFLEAVSLGNSLQFDEVNIDLQKFIFAQTVKEFRVTPSGFDKNKGPAYIQARCTCFYLYYTYAKLSSSKILLKHKKFQGTRSRVDSAIRKMAELVKLPAIDKLHHAKFRNVETRVIEFIESSKKK